MTRKRKKGLKRSQEILYQEAGDRLRGSHQSPHDGVPTARRRGRAVAVRDSKNRKLEAYATLVADVLQAHLADELVVPIKRHLLTVPSSRVTHLRGIRLNLKN